MKAMPNTMEETYEKIRKFDNLERDRRLGRKMKAIVETYMEKKDKRFDKMAQAREKNIYQACQFNKLSY